jgi:opacity protein-like surface antigen
MRRTWLIPILLLLTAAMAVQPALSQEVVQKWSAYGGYSYLNTPTNNLSQNGFNLVMAHNTSRRWLALGADFSHYAGSGTQVASLAGQALQVPYNASTTNFAAGPQLEYRRKWITPFFRPYLGLFHMTAAGQPNKIAPPEGVPAAVFQQMLASIPTATLNSALTKSATNLGYGSGGGADFNLTDLYAVRVSCDYIRTAMFGARQNNVRISTGLVYRFGGPVGESR